MKTPLDYDELDDSPPKRNYFYFILFGILITFYPFRALISLILFIITGSGPTSLVDEKYPYFLVVAIQALIIYYLFRKRRLLKQESLLLAFLSLVIFIFELDYLVLNFLIRI